MAIKQTPKKNMRGVDFSYKHPSEGTARRISYQKEILENAPVFPKPVSYEDIDASVFDFVDNELDFVIDGKKIPTFTTFSSQRFSEYMQTWEYSDQNGNIYHNFKTLSRETNPSPGTSQNKMWNIPGFRDYPILTRTVMEDDGKECYECYSMKQPIAVDLTYTVHFVSNLMENLNEFNQELMTLFSSRQCYIRPNGHWMPLILDSVSDSTTYTTTDMKVYVQVATIKCMAYIIKESDFTVKKFPKNININDTLLDGSSHKVGVDIDEYIDKNIRNTVIELNLKFPKFKDKVEFEIDTDMVVEETITDNVRNTRVFVNDNPIYIDKGFQLHNGDALAVKVFPFRYDLESKVTFKGYNPSSVYDKSKITNFEKDETPRFEELNVEA